MTSAFLSLQAIVIPHVFIVINEYNYNTYSNTHIVLHFLVNMTTFVSTSFQFNLCNLTQPESVSLNDFIHTLAVHCKLRTHIS